MKKILKYALFLFALSYGGNLLSACTISSVIGDKDICYNTSTSLTVTYNGCDPTNPAVKWMIGSIEVGFAQTYVTDNLIANTTYSVIITDADESDTSQVTVTVNPEITITAPPVPDVCQGMPAMLLAVASGGTGPFTYNWNNGMTGSFITVFDDGTYTVTATDSHSDMCTQVASIDLTVHPVPIANAGGNQSICSGSVTLTGTATNGTPPYSYSWSNGQNTQMINVMIPGTYFLTVTDFNGCTDVDDVMVSINPAINVNAGADIEECQGETVNVNVATTGGTVPYSYAWSTGQSGNPISFPAMNSSTITVTVTDGAGCTETDEIMLTVFPRPSVNAGSNVTTCFITSVTLTANGSGGTPPYTYDWSNGESEQVIIITTSGTYTVTITDDNDCTNEDNVVVSINPAINVNTGADIEGCLGETVSINAVTTGGSAPYSYAWSTGQSGNPISFPAMTSGTITVTVTDDANCTETDEIVLTVFPKPSVDAGADVAICPGENTTLTAVGSSGTEPYDYHWNNGETGPVIMVSVAGNYVVTISDDNNCTDTDNVGVTVFTPPNLTLDATPNAVCNGGSSTIVASGGVSYEWSTGEMASVITVFPDMTTAYSVTITDGNGCTEEGSTTIIVAIDPSVKVNGSTTICKDGSISEPLEASVTGGTGTPVFSWEESLDGGNTWTLVGSNSATFDPGVLTVRQLYLYRVKVSFSGNGNLGCPVVTSDPATVDVVKRPDPIISNFAISQFGEVCQNQQSLFFIEDIASEESSLFDWWDQEAKPGMPAILDTFDYGSLLVIHWGNVPGSYALDVRESLAQGNNLDCSGSDVLTVKVGTDSSPNPAEIFISPINNILVYNDSTVSCYQWGYFDPETNRLETISGENYQSYAVGEAYNPNRVYWCRVWDGNCGNPTCATTAIYRSGNTQVIPEEVEPQFVLYPNPTSGNFRLKTNQLFVDTEYEVRIINTLGQLVQSEKTYTQNDVLDLEVQMNGKSAGVYFVGLYLRGHLEKVSSIVIQP